MQDNFAYLLPFILTTFGTIFLSLQTIGFRPGRYWGLGYLCAAAGFAVPMVLTQNFLLVQTVISNILFFAGFFFYGHALLVQFGVDTHLRARLGLAAAGFLCVCFFIFVEPNLRNGLATSDAALATLLAPSIVLVRRRTRNVMDKLLLVAVSLVVMETLTRVVMLLSMTSSASMESLDTYMSSDYAYFAQFAASIFGFLMALSVLASAAARVLEQHRSVADHDPLTGVLNRRGFDLSAPDFRSDAREGVVLMCDIDHFKSVNDRFGHATGDLVIIRLAELLKERLPPDAKIARFGGEEFVAFVPKLTAPEVAVLANMVRSAFAAKTWVANRQSGQITASFGISSVARGDHSIHDAISRADVCLYKAKENGRNQVVQEGVSPLNAGTGADLKIVSV